MSQSQNYFADDEEFSSLSLDECRQRLQVDEGSNVIVHQLLRRIGHLLVVSGAYEEALSSLNRALKLKPDDAIAHVYRAQALEGIGSFSEAIAAYDRALASLSAPTSELAAAIWTARGNVWRTLKGYVQALESYDRALAIQPDLAYALSNRSVALAALKQYQQALIDSNRAIALQPNAYEVWNNHGIILLIAGRPSEALPPIDRALELQPHFDKAWNNRAIALSRLGREPEAIASLEQALHYCTHPCEPWYASAWVFRGYLLMKSGRFQEAIASLEKGQSYQPASYPAAFYKLICLVLSGQFLRKVVHAESRKRLCQDLGIVGRSLRYRLLIMVGLIGSLGIGQHLLQNYSQGTALESWASNLIPLVLSIGIVSIIAVDLWRNKSRLSFVWQTYFQSGFLTYIRATGIIAATLTTFELAARIAPPVLFWGWANWVFGQPGNVILQPLFNLLERAAQLSPIWAWIHSASQLTGAITVNLPIVHFGLILAFLKAPTWFRPNQINYGVLFILGFWLLLLMGIPFWARLEERIFRQGANTWKQIFIRSVQFGLVHLLAGIPILGGFVLIVPGFLFACRYKYVHDRHLKHYRDPIQAQEAGVIASTADHAVYNAILITIVVSSLLWVEWSTP
jgi:tetratricopeptide (TPR) repeat protein